MPIKLADCVRETTTTTGTGTLTLSGTAPLVGDRTFSASVSAAGLDDLTDGCTTVIRIEEVDGSGNPTGAWELCKSVFTVSGNTVTRGTLKSSSTGSRVSFAAGTKYVSVVAPASMIEGGGGLTGGRTITATGSLAATDVNRLLISNVATAHTITIENDATLLTDGSENIQIYIAGAGMPTIAPGTGVDIVGPQGFVGLMTGSLISLRRAYYNTGDSHTVWSVELTGYTTPLGQANTGTTLNIPASWVDTDTPNTSSNAATQTLTIQPASAVPVRDGAEISIMQIGAGKVTIAPGSGVTLASGGSTFSTAETNNPILLKNIATDSWVMLGKRIA